MLLRLPTADSGAEFPDRGVLSKKTGVRNFPAGRYFLIFVLCGWFISLLFIIHLQDGALPNRKKHSRTEVVKPTLRNRTHEAQGAGASAEQLGILRDTAKEYAMTAASPSRTGDESASSSMATSMAFRAPCTMTWYAVVAIAYVNQTRHFIIISVKNHDMQLPRSGK